MNYSSLEDVYGTPFGARAPINHVRKDIKEQPIAKPEFSSMEKRSEEAVEKNKKLIASVEGSLPLDTNPITENFNLRHVEQRDPIAVREKFTQPQQQVDRGSYDQDKLARILRLIEQNRTGYEQPATQDMALYIFTGVFFLFTFDTFVMMGKTMGRRY